LWLPVDLPSGCRVLVWLFCQIRN